MEMQNFGFGKTIILGEHFVVHGLPALVAALPMKTCAHIKDNNLNELVFVDDRPKSPEFVQSKSVQYRQMIDNILIALKINHRNFTITVAGDLVVTCGGIGASAACATAITKAFNHKLNLGLTDNQINEVVLYAEGAVHGTPSGIDNTAAVFGGTFKFIKPSCREPIILPGPLKIILVDSGKRADTMAMISTFKNFLISNPDNAEQVFNLYKQIFDRGLRALKGYDLQALGRCMNENHKLLQQAGLSCPELDFIVANALRVGAFGAKLTGTGGGGLALILTSERYQSRIAQYFEGMGYLVIKTEIL